MDKNKRDFRYINFINVNEECLCSLCCNAFRSQANIRKLTLNPSRQPFLQMRIFFSFADNGDKGNVRTCCRNRERNDRLEFHAKQSKPIASAWR